MRENIEIQKEDLVERTCTVAIGATLFERKYIQTTIAEAARQCALEFAESYFVRSDIVRGCKVDVIVVDEIGNRHELAISVKAVATWIDHRKGCGDD